MMMMIFLRRTRQGALCNGDAPLSAPSTAAISLPSGFDSTWRHWESTVTHESNANDDDDGGGGDDDDDDDDDDAFFLCATLSVGRQEQRGPRRDQKHGSRVGAQGFRPADPYLVGSGIRACRRYEHL